MKNDEVIQAEIVSLIKTIDEKRIENHQDDDYQFARDNLKQLVEKGNVALDGVLELAAASDHPRVYEVVGQMIRSLGETNKDIIELQKDMKKLKDEEGPSKVTQNAIFVGSTAELQKFLKDSKKKEIKEKSDGTTS
jgi:hypothetical protein